MIWLLSFIEYVAGKFRQYQEERRQKEELEEILRNNRAIDSWPSGSLIRELHYRGILKVATDTTDDDLDNLCIALNMPLKDIYVWWCTFRELPPVEAKMCISHFGFHAIITAAAKLPPVQEITHEVRSARTK